MDSSIFFYGGPKHCREETWHFFSGVPHQLEVTIYPKFDEIFTMNPKDPQLARTHRYYLLRSVRLNNNKTLSFFISEDEHAKI